MNNNKTKSVDFLNVLKISGAFMAFLIGSGFATGQEALQFFVANGLKGVLGIAIILIFFIYLVNTFLKVGKERGLKRNEDVFKFYSGNIAGAFFTWYTMAFIIGVHAIMLSGAGATLHQYYGLPPIVGSTAIALLSMATLLLGLKKIVEFIAGIGPVIVAMIIFIAIAVLIKNPGSIFRGNDLIPTLNILSASSSWILSAFLYVGLSILGLASLLPAIGTTIESKKDIAYISFLGPLFFCTGLVFVSLALISQVVEVNGQMIPIMGLANSVLPIYGTIFAVIIFLGIYSTATPLIWTVCARFAEEGTTRYRVLVVALTGVGYFGGMLLPFDKLVNLIYPTVGYVGIAFLIFVVIKDLKAAFKK